ncbi:hypothetical protein ACWCXK_07485 [Streptomyces sp. NPDC001739]
MGAERDTGAERDMGAERDVSTERDVGTVALLSQYVRVGRRTA